MDNTINNDDKKEITTLADESRVSVMSPGMMIYKRFMRNKLAIAGMIILIVMFLFSFVGGFLWPHGQSTVFIKMDYTPKDYASAVYNTELRFTLAAGQTLPDAARAQFMFISNKKETSFTVHNINYIVNWVTDDFAIISGYKQWVEADVLRNRIIYKNID